MYASRSSASRPISAGAALLINGALIAGLIFAAPEIIPKPPDKTFTGTQIPLTDPPPPDPQPRAQPRIAKTAITPPIHRIDPVVTLPPSGPKLGTTPDLVVPTFDPPARPGAAASDPPIAPPVLVDAVIDPRHAAAFQPDYPGTELRLNREGVVKVRVRIGVDGRIKAVEPVSSPGVAFFDATRRHALTRWRFQPATRDGIPVESWKVMTVRFRITS